MSKTIAHIRREPVAIGFVAAAVAFAAAFGWEIPNDWAERAKDALSLALWVFTLVKTRSKVTPV